MQRELHPFVIAATTLPRESMNVTSASLLVRLRDLRRDEDWARFVKLYTPLLCFWANRLGLQQQDTADLLQEVFAILVVKLPEFNYEPGGSFRGWLRTILMNCWRNWRSAWCFGSA